MRKQTIFFNGNVILQFTKVSFKASTGPQFTPWSLWNHQNAAVPPDMPKSFEALLYWDTIKERQIHINYREMQGSGGVNTGAQSFHDYVRASH
jgi:hypothetical protein